MNYLICVMILSSFNTTTIFDFNKESELQNWSIVNDDVMGGRSSSSLSQNNKGLGVFKGDVSLENNGGFSSARYRFTKIAIKEKTKVRIRLKGDGKRYQFRIKDHSERYYSYISTFLTSGEWQYIEIPLVDMYPSFRGRTLDLPYFSHSCLEEIAFLIANGKNEKFELLIDKIELI